MKKIVDVQDERTRLLNNDCGGVISVYNTKFNMIKDFLIQGRSHIYIDRKGLKVNSLRYVNPSDVMIMGNNDPIFKEVQYSVMGKPYNDFDFITLANTTDGVTFSGLVNQNKTLLESAMYMLNNNKVSAKNSNAPKGIIESEIDLSPEALEELKSTWRKFVNNGTEQSFVLNQGLKFQSVGGNNQQNQIVEQQTLLDKQICALFGTSIELINGTATEEVEKAFIRSKLIPLLDKLIEEYNRVLLLESEKDSMFFAFDLTEISKDASMKDRMEGYKVALESNIMDINTVRKLENLPTIPNLDGVLKMNLSDVLFNVNNGTSMILNLGKTIDLDGNIEEDTKSKILQEQGGEHYKYRVYKYRV
ncbi:phage portal protein [Clostridium paraputrificum]|uniref:phage portal protein n=1 Tax=Clostridium paraputrificum TaxID=29363 RepID=UPI000C0766AC|nr:phage portal protein [Clostridium paraputrificum]